MWELLGGTVLGVILGAAFEAATSFLQARWLRFKYRHIRGTYEILRSDGTRNGFVTIQPEAGRRFSTRATQELAPGEWVGSFELEHPSAGPGHGVYRYTSSAPGARPNWGQHYLMLMESGDFVVQWHNFSDAQDDKGSVTWHRVSERIEASS